jgi:hypothetical protein
MAVGQHDCQPPGYKKPANALPFVPGNIRTAQIQARIIIAGPFTHPVWDRFRGLRDSLKGRMHSSSHPKLSDFELELWECGCFKTTFSY